MRNRSLRAATCLCLVTLSSLANAVTFFDVWEYQVQGVESIDKTEVQRAIAPYLGSARTIDDVDKAAQAIQKLYQSAGFPTTAIGVPDQDINSGVIKIQVEESKIRRVTVVGAKYFSPNNIREQFPALQAGEVLNIAKLQTDVREANRINRDLHVIPALKASPQPGAVDVELNVDDQVPLHGGIEVTNYHTETTTALRLGGDIRYGNLWQKNHEASLQVQITPENTDEVKVIAGSYLFPVNDRGGKIATYIVISDSDLAVDVSGINVVGDGEIYGLRWVQPVKQSASAVHSFALGGDFKDYNEDIVLLDDSTTTTPIQYSTFSAQYNLYHRSDHITDSFSTGFTYGSRLLGNDSEEFGQKRSQADTSFALWRLDWERTYAVFSSWSFKHSIRGQMTESALVSNEQMSAGGVGSVRGYYESQVQGDAGWIGNLELAAPAWQPERFGLRSATPYLFYDIARLKINEPLPDQVDYFAISSIGIGLTAQLYADVKLKVESGYPLEAQGSVEKGDFRTRASVRMDF